MWRLSTYLLLLTKGSFLQLVFCYLPDSITCNSKRLKTFRSYISAFVKGNERNNSGDLSRLAFLQLNLDRLCASSSLGSFAEVGCWKGNTSSVLARYASDRHHLYLCDSFDGFDANQLVEADMLSSEILGSAFKNTSLESVSSLIDPITSHYTIVPGFFPLSATPEMKLQEYLLVLIDCDLYEPIADSLEFFLPRMKPNGIILVHDYNSPYYQGATEAVDEFCLKHSLTPILIPDKSGTIAISV